MARRPSPRPAAARPRRAPARPAAARPRAGGATATATRADRALLWVGVAGPPLAIWPWGEDTHAPAQLIVLAVLTGLLAVIPWRGSLPRPLAAAALGAVAVAGAAAVFGAAPVAQLLGRYPRYEGVPVLLGYVVALACGAAVASRGAPLRPSVHRVVAVVTVILTLTAVIEVVVRPAYRIQTTIGNASAVGVWAAMAWGLLLHAVVTQRDRWVVAGLGAAGVLVGLSASRGALLGAGVATLVVLLPRALAREWRTAAGIAGAGLGVAALALLLPMSRSRLSGSSPLAESTVTGRSLLWEQTARLVGDHPLVGVGPSGFVDALGRYNTPQWQAAVGPDFPPDSPHSLPLQVLASTGILGALAALTVAVLVVAALARAIRAGDGFAVAVAAGLAGAVTAWSVHFSDPATAVPLLVLLGSAVGVPGAAPARPTPPLRWAALALAGLFAVAGLTALVSETALLQMGYAVEAADDPRPSLDLAVGARPWDPDVARRAGHAIVVGADAGRTDASIAIPVLESACARLPSSTECRVDLGDAREAAGDHAGALQALAQAAALDPTNPSVMIRQGIAYAGLSDYARAEASFRAAAAMRPSATGPWENLVRLFELTGNASAKAAASAELERLRAAAGPETPAP